jgi:hypothetical protein
MILQAILLFVGLITELMSVQLLFQNSVQTSLIIHCVSSLSISLAVLLFLGKYYRHEIWIAFLFTFLLSFFIPVSGLIIILFVVSSVFSTHTKFHKHTEILDDSINLRDIKPVHRRYGAGGAVMHLLNKAKPTSERARALFRMGEGNLASVNSLMFQLFSDKSDEIRLLAFNILEQQESSISEDINKLLEMLKTTDLKQETTAKLEKNLAMLYWEFVYRNLLLRELEPSMLQNAEHHALSALKVLDNDATLWALLGKIYERMKKYDLAAEAFSKTADFNIPPSQVLPYLAEIEFHVRNYGAVQKYLNESDALSDVALIAPVKRFWSDR